MTCGSGLRGLCHLAPTTQLRTTVGAQEEAESFESEKSCVQSVLNKRTIQEPMIQPERRVMPISYEVFAIQHQRILEPVVAPGFERARMARHAFV
ncbi:hypothetical protein NC652_038738 [Populus alba x Populus x berolinensis]|nr:hypothetical protein NC652_038738 [Populus alba x Populus x berolinensis]